MPKRHVAHGTDHIRPVFDKDFLLKEQLHFWTRYVQSLAKVTTKSEDLVDMISAE